MDIKNEFKKSMLENCPLSQVKVQEEEAKQFGFYWQNLHQILEQIRSECLEVEEAYENNEASHLQEEIGDLIQAAVCVAVFCQFDPIETLQKSINKFQQRYDMLVDLTLKDGLSDLKNKSNEELLAYWNRVKELKK